MAALVLLTAGCTSEDDPDRSTASSTPSAAPGDATAALRERCLSAIPDDADLEAMTLTGRTGGTLEAARIGPEANDTVAVLLPQTSGLCGWGRWASAAHTQAGLTSLLVNPCGYGGSTCAPEEDVDPLNEVAAAVAVARDEVGADRVVLIGASMGGSLTVIAAAQGADVDAWADVSGPSAWDGVDLAVVAEVHRDRAAGDDHRDGDQPPAPREPDVGVHAPNLGEHAPSVVRRRERAAYAVLRTPRPPPGGRAIAPATAGWEP